jgi:hypothetical protein
MGESGDNPDTARADFEEALHQFIVAENLMRGAPSFENKLRELRQAYARFLFENGDLERARDVICVAWYHDGSWDMTGSELESEIMTALHENLEKEDDASNAEELRAERAAADAKRAADETARQRRIVADLNAVLHSRAPSSPNPGLPLSAPTPNPAANGGGLPLALETQSRPGKGGTNSGNLPLALPRSADSQKSQAGTRPYTPSGNGIIGGTTWITGYYVPPGSAPELKAQAARMMILQTRLAGIPYNESVDFNRYNFVFGIAASTSAFTDLRNRVLFDDLTNGKSTPELQNAYNALRGRSFGELACHSNGAMICLAALEKQDVEADRVVLYGPQITAESLLMWQQLIEEHRIRSVQLYINQNDPVPPISMAFAGGLALSMASAPLFKVGVMDNVVHTLAPGISVKTFSCGDSTLTLDCHSLSVYKRERGCKPSGTPPAGVVPGTKLSNGKGVLEPPPPC